MEPPPRSPPHADPLEARPPAFTLEQVEVIAQEIFGIAGSMSLLDSERDQNVRVVSDEGESFLLKISNPADDSRVIDMQTQALLHIATRNPGLPVMQPVRTLAGSLHAEVPGAERDRHLVRLLTFLPGRIVPSVEMDTRALRHFGAMVARMGLALRGFFHSAGGYKILWDLKNTPSLRPLVEFIPDRPHRLIAERVLDRFDERVGPLLPGLRSQIIHNDLTVDNVLLDESARVSGIVDFGDLTHTALICDLAITLVSLMWGRPDPLEAAGAAIEGYASVASIEDGEAHVLSDLVSARLAALVVIANWRVRRYPQNAEYITANEDLAWALLERIDTLGFPVVRARMEAACAGPGMSSSPIPINELLERRARILNPALSPLSYDHPLYLVRGEGSRLFDHEDRSYLDAYNNVPVVGHSHPRVAAAIADQSRTLNTNTRYLHDSVIELAERIVATMPGALDTVMFVNSGSEANDIAWRLATAYGGGTGAIVTARAYHGVTAATIALSPEEWVNGERPVHVETVPPPDGYRGPYRRDEPEWAKRYADHVGAALAALERRGIDPAAMYVDSLFTSDGIFAAPPLYFEEVTRRLRDAGCLFVADEVQSGFGRTGAHMWSFQASGITPDFVTLGKPMGNGHPVGAIVTRREIAERFASRTEMFSTFGGNPVACGAALAVLEVLEIERLQERAADTGAYLHANLETLAEQHDSMGDVRGLGLMVGVELVRDKGTRTAMPGAARAVMNRMKEKGVLVGSTGPDDNILKIRPPLVLTRAEADLIVETLGVSLAELAAP